MNTRHFYISSSIICFCFFALYSQAKAAPATVNDIIKTSAEATPHVLSLDTTTKDIVGAPTETPQIIDTVPFVLRLDLLHKPQAIRTSFTTTLDPRATYAWVAESLTRTSFTPEDAEFEMENGRVSKFNPGRTGLVPDARLTTLATIHALTDKQTDTVAIAGIPLQPRTTLASINSLGIQEFLSGGISDFSNSSKNRLANIEAGMNQVKGVLVKPGDIFSFGEYLGDITAEQGFKPEIVIKADGLKPELGGGICQVSSTLFRAVMQSGMQVTQRKNHAFSVSHYYPAGTDATIYTPVTDLKFKNDTPAHILIWPHYLDKTHLAFDLYGTSDGREVVVDEPIHTDRKADGSLKASWTRHVTVQGVTREDTFKSNYLPPALFKKEETFVTASPAPTPTQTPEPTPSATQNNITN
ncbi:MAG: VanW family protein [Candidatus Doudnabacteria bacterium]|nr:VanW family protein [Candidatus Doudnabacteria bacterium]